MVRTPQKSCPNLSRLHGEAEPTLVLAFLRGRSFSRLHWLQKHLSDASDPASVDQLAALLREKTKDELFPLETEAARIMMIASSRGQFALVGLAETKLAGEQRRNLMRRRDELARSLWTYVHEKTLFEAVENSLHQRLYRRYDRHYQTFPAPVARNSDREPGSTALQGFLNEISAVLDRGEGYSIDRFDLPGDEDEPTAEMYLLLHPDPPTSVREIDDKGERSRIYFRPPGEAVVVFVPSTGRIHVRANTRKLRRLIAEKFCALALGEALPENPVDFQVYDITRFLADIDLDLPDFEDVQIISARVIRLEVSIGALSSRLAVYTTLETGVTTVLKRQSQLAGVVRDAIAVRFVEIAVQYRRYENQQQETLSFTISDRNTSSLLSLDDPFEMVLGHRLLRHWQVLLEGRGPAMTDGMGILDAVMALWDQSSDLVYGDWLLTRSVDTKALSELGFLVPAGWAGDDLTEDEAKVGLAEEAIRSSGDDIILSVVEGQEVPATSIERYRRYRVRGDWVTKHLKDRGKEIVDRPDVRTLAPDLLLVGLLEADGKEVPVYLARGLGDERRQTAVDTELRALGEKGHGLVLHAGKACGPTLGSNVLVRIGDHVGPEAAEIPDLREQLRTEFRQKRLLAQGGQVVTLEGIGPDAKTLSVPGKGTIDIVGANRVLVIQRLVDAHNSGATPVPCGYLTKGFEGQSLANIFKQPLWNKLKAGFLRTPRFGFWEIAI